MDLLLVRCRSRDQAATAPCSVLGWLLRGTRSPTY